MTAQDLLEKDDDYLSEYLETVSLEDFRSMLAQAIAPLPGRFDTNWSATNDGMQWVVKRDAEADVLDSERKPTGEKKRVESIIGYYPRISQAMRRIYEGYVADGASLLERDNMLAVVERCEAVHYKLLEEKG